MVPGGGNTPVAAPRHQMAVIWNKNEFGYVCLIFKSSRSIEIVKICIELFYIRFIFKNVFLAEFFLHEGVVCVH